ncbi:MAG: three-Cys-motif partner protein TcmP [Thermoplasmatales archaeon]|nr:three-Cys-motif partner protein TcmP [Thermoplasmatales archaeon]
MEVKPHTSLKHRILGCYFRICRNVMKGKNKKLFYVDLYAGDGICKCNRAPLQKWAPPYFSLLEYAKKENLYLKCIFNDIDASKINNLKIALEPYNEYVLKIFNEDTNVVYKKVLKLIPSNEWSIFFLDPSNHNHLYFSTIKEISSHSFSSPDYIRKPELIITLMTYTMQQYIKQSKRKNLLEAKKNEYLCSVDKAIGTQEWRKWLIDRNGKKFHQAICDIFISQLSRLGYDTVYFNINQTTADNVIYYLIFATSVPDAYKIISKKFEPYIKKIKEDEWVKENFKFYKKAIAKEKGIKLLDEFSS